MITKLQCNIIKALLVILILVYLIIFLFIFRETSDDLDKYYMHSSADLPINKLIFYAIIGDKVAQLELGDMYSSGIFYNNGHNRLGCCDNEKALYWYKRASHNNPIESRLSNIELNTAILNANIYLEGGNDVKDVSFWIGHSAKEGNTIAKYIVKNCSIYTDNKQLAKCLVLNYEKY